VDEIPLLPANKIARGTFQDARIPPTIARISDVQNAITQALEQGIDPEHTHPLASPTEPGMMAPEDKAKLDSLSVTPTVDGLDDVPGLIDALALKANAAHGHTFSDVDGLTAALSGKANTAHTHTIAAVDGLTSVINTLSTDIAALGGSLAGKANTAHTHTVGEIQRPYAWARFFQQVGSAVTSLNPIDSTATNLRANLITYSAADNGFRVQNAGLYLLTAAGRLNDYSSVTQTNLYLAYNGSWEVTSINAYCVCQIRLLAANDLVQFQAFINTTRTLSGSMSLYQIA
jgi:Phage tail repeat like